MIQHEKGSVAPSLKCFLPAANKHVQTPSLAAENRPPTLRYPNDIRNGTIDFAPLCEVSTHNCACESPTYQSALPPMRYFYVLMHIFSLSYPAALPRLSLSTRLQSGDEDTASLTTSVSSERTKRLIEVRCVCIVFALLGVSGVLCPLLGRSAKRLESGPFT